MYDFFLNSAVVTAIVFVLLVIAFSALATNSAVLIGTCVGLILIGVSVTFGLSLLGLALVSGQ